MPACLAELPEGDSLQECIHSIPLNGFGLVRFGHVGVHAIFAMGTLEARGRGRGLDSGMGDRCMGRGGD